MPRVLISVFDKTGVVDFARRLELAGFDILSTGGTARTLREAGIGVTDVSEVTGFPEILDGRVKTLHPAVHGGLLARRDVPAHMATLDELGIGTIEMLVSNLYPFESVLGSEGATDEEIIENIDIGGPAMIRSAAKTHADVLVVTRPSDYDRIADAVETGGVASVSAGTRRELAAIAFGHVSRYDSLIAAYLRGESVFPDELTIGGRLLHEARYGENPHQRAAVYATSRNGGVGSWKLLSGGELSFNNYLDASSAWQTANVFESPAVAIVKHTLPCGIGTNDDLAEAFNLALSGDPVSAFGGILGCNRVVTARMVEAIGRLRLDVMVAPGYEPEALATLSRRRNLRIIEDGGVRPASSMDLRSVPGGFLIQDEDRVPVDPSTWRTATGRGPTSEELEALVFAWRVIPFVKSNAIVMAKRDHLVGMGAGQPNRVESVRLAAQVASSRAAGSALASDAFFPFADGIEAAADAGVTAIVQPGGSVRDGECIAAADAHNIAMVFTGERHFRH